MHTRRKQSKQSKQNKSIRCKATLRKQRTLRKQKGTRHTRKGGFIGKILRRQRYSKDYNEDGKHKGTITSDYYDQMPELMKLRYERRESRPTEYKLRKGFRMPVMQPLGQFGQYSQQPMPQLGQPYMPQGYMPQGYMPQPYMPLGTTKTVIKGRPY